MDNQAIISIILPVYNCEKYLSRCLLSIQNQTYRNLQIICVDDGSTDSSADIAKSFAEEDNRFVYVREDNRGESFARNHGLSLALGDYISFVDCDDFIDADMYESLIGTALQYNSDITACGWYKEFDSKSVPMKNMHHVPTSSISKRDFIHHVYCRDEYQSFAYMWNKLFKRNVIFHEEGALRICFDEDLRLGGDVLFMAMAMMLCANKFAYVDGCYYHYYQRYDSTTHISSFSLKEDQIGVYEKLIELYTSAEIDVETIGLVKRFYVYHCSNLMEMALEKGNGEIAEVAGAKIKKYLDVYIETNRGHKDRIDRIRKLLTL